MTEAMVAREKNVLNWIENRAKESFISRHFWLNFSRLELTFHVSQFTGAVRELKNLRRGSSSMRLQTKEFLSKNMNNL